MLKWLRKSEPKTYQTWVDVPRATVEQVLETVSESQQVYQLSDFPISLSGLLKPLQRPCGWHDCVTTGRRIPRNGVRGYAIAIDIARALRVRYVNDSYASRRGKNAKAAVLASFN